MDFFDLLKLGTNHEIQGGRAWKKKGELVQYFRACKKGWASKIRVGHVIYLDKFGFQ